MRKIIENKDNFWTLIFATGLSIGCFIAGLFGIFVAALIMGFVLSHFNGVTFKDNKFFTKEGRELNLKTDIPHVGTVIIAAIGASIATGFFLDKYFKSLNDFFSGIIILSVMFGIPAWLFIRKNCPISILFNFKLWTMEDPNNSSTPYKSHSQSNFTQVTYRPENQATRSIINDPIYRNLSCNVYNRDRFK